MNGEGHGLLTKEELMFLRILHYSDVVHNKKERKKSGFLYLVKDNASNLIKIGITTNYKSRLKQLNRMVPHGIIPVAIYPAENYEVLEKDVHERYKDKRVNGEWFDFDNADVEDCKKYIENII